MKSRLLTYHWRQAMTTEDISLRESLGEVLVSAAGDASDLTEEDGTSEDL